MAVREDENRRVGGGSEKLLTLEEAARRLSIPADDVGSLIRAGKLPSFRLGGSMLRVRLADVEMVGQEVRRSRSARVPAEEISASGYTLPAASHAWWDRVADFFYFNDFYLVAILLILTLLAIIFAL